MEKVDGAAVDAERLGHRLFVFEGNPKALVRFTKKRLTNDGIVVLVKRATRCSFGE